MTSMPDTELTTSSSRWAVHFLFDQRGSWGESKSQWKWIGKGEISVEHGALT
jgi:hypothetical protein